MTRTHRVQLWLLTILFASGVVASSCNSDTPATPVGPQPPSGGPPPTAATPGVVRIEIVVPSIAPGQTVQLAVKVFRSDNTQESVTEGVRWTNPFSNVLQVTAAGLATGRAAGEATVFAAFGSHSTSAEMLILPENTFRLKGVVRDFDFGIPDVTVAVISGIGTGLTTRTLSDGSYRLFGVAGDVVLQVKKEGYGNVVATVPVTAHRSYDVPIAVNGTRSDYGGAYTLVLRADGVCTWLPPEMRERRYDAELRQDGGRITISLRNGAFVLNNGRGNGFEGYVDGTGGFRFPISDVVLDYDWYYYLFYTGSFDIAERIGDETMLVHGVAVASATGGQISGTFDGHLRTTGRVQPPFLPFRHICHSQRHRFELRRR